MLIIPSVLFFLFISTAYCRAPSTCSRCLGSQTCNPPDCFCCRDELKLPLSIRDTPQIVFFTFDDAVTNQVARFYRQLFDSSRKNPNGCPISMTLFISHENTNYHLVSEFYQKGMEIAAHSVTHSHLNPQNFLNEARNQKNNLAKLGNVPAEKIKGWRSPYLESVGDAQPDMLKQLGYKYDATLTFSKRRLKEKGPMPFTLDFGWPYECQIKPCPLKAHKGFWEVPVISLLDYLKKYDCVYVDGCLNPPPDEASAYNFLWNNFKSYYTATRVPFGINMHPAWFFVEERLQAMDRFISDLAKMDDVYIVSASQTIDWLQNPKPLSQLNHFEPWSCNGRNTSSDHANGSVGQSINQNIQTALETRRQQVLQRWQNIKELQRDRRLRQQREWMRGTVQVQKSVQHEQAPPSWTVQHLQQPLPGPVLQIPNQANQTPQQQHIPTQLSPRELLVQQRLYEQRLLEQHALQQQLLLQKARQQQQAVALKASQTMAEAAPAPHRQLAPQGQIAQNEEPKQQRIQTNPREKLVTKHVRQPLLPRETAQEQTDLAQRLLAQQKRLSHVLQGRKKAGKHGHARRAKDSRKLPQKPQTKPKQETRLAKGNRIRSKNHLRSERHRIRYSEVTLPKLQEVQNKNNKIPKLTQTQPPKQEVHIQQLLQPEKQLLPIGQNELMQHMGLQPLPLAQVSEKTVNKISQAPFPKLGLQPLPVQSPTQHTTIQQHPVVNPTQELSVDILQYQAKVLQSLPDINPTLEPQSSPSQQQQLREQMLAEQQLREKQLAEQQLRDKQLAEQQLREKQLAEQQLREKQLAEQQLREKQLAEQQLREKQLAEQQLREKQLAEQKLREQTLAEQQLREKQLAKQQLREKQIAEKKLKEQKLAEKQLLEKQLAEQQIREKQIADQQLRDQKLAEQQLREKQLAEQQIREKQLAEQQLREQKLAEQQLREKQLAEQQLREKQLAAQQLREQQLAKQQQIEQQLVEQQLREKQLAEQQIRETQLAEQQLRDQKLAEQQLRQTQLAEQHISRKPAIQDHQQLLEHVRQQQQQALKQQQLQLQRQQHEVIQRQQLEEQRRRQRQDQLTRKRQQQAQTQSPWMEQQTSQWAQAHIPPTVPQHSQDSWRRFLMFIMGEA